MTEELESSIKERLGIRSLEKSDQSIAGSCINSGHCFKLDNNERIFVKTNTSHHAFTMFEGEFASLKQIMATESVKVPKPRLVLHNYDITGASAIVMEYFDLKPLDERSARQLGQELARLHDYNNKVARYHERARKWIGGRSPSAKIILEQVKMAKKTTDNQVEDENRSNSSEDETGEIRFAKHDMRISERTTGNSSSQAEYDEFASKFVPNPDADEITEFGFHVSTSCGLIPQVNDWTDDWVSFYARHRLDKSIRSLLSDHGDRELNQQWSHLQLKVDKFFSDFCVREGDKIVPALLHGDLWSGNVAQLNDTSQPIVYDPSSFYGHSEYDFGIARMFGRLPKALENAYFELIPKRKLFEMRNKLYQLFHQLNHWDHFGSGYRASTLNIMKDLNAMV